MKNGGIKNLTVLFVFASLHSNVSVCEEVSTLKADGPNEGLSAYELIKNFAGKRPIESPDLYPENHPEIQHIYEDTDDVVGHHFVFLLHRDIDRDRDKYKRFSDRQRNEIKAYSGSKRRLKGYEGEILTYRWKFKLEPDMSLSKNFSHFFQLKSVDDGVGTPIFTFSGRHYRGEKWFAFSHAAVKKTTILEKNRWNKVSGVWLEAEVTAVYANKGTLKVTLKRLEDQVILMEYQSDTIDMWRGTKASHFVRPKWGLYRSLKSKSMLESEEDTIRFADFEVIKP
ncbi:hypothetical protein J3L16_01735 [Alteromonas sp. 5E99-2]|uniref:hypothetical protein n=1 Tax=Alteromonas sp. 5E99-2 TaxID=2817683 RepID=UPI001A989B83|nr:hypothetical protein [Alteromonas sp. 5E99-2]MBO1254401.1 hypothetical protein [Alteromonas sp. 5E99-2]